MSATIKDVSKLSGISIATVSKFLNNVPVREKTAKKISAAIEELGYVPNPMARSLRASKTRTVGILVNNITNNFYNIIISQLTHLLQEEDYGCLLYDYHSENGDNSFERACTFFSEKKVDGVFIIDNTLSQKAVETLNKLFTSVVVIDCYLNNLNADYVVTDNLTAAYHATEQFIIRGHKKIALITGHGDLFSAHQRLIGYRHALEDNGITVREDYIFRDEYDMNGGYQAFKRLAGFPKEEAPTAVLIASYFMTIGSIIALNEQKLTIPEDLSVICFDNYDINRVFVPALTCIAQPTEEICKQALTCMIERIAGTASEPRIFRLSATLEDGASVRTITNS